MSTGGTTSSALATDGTDRELPSQPWESRTARFAAHWGPTAVVVTASGELDAANAVQLADFVQRCAAHSEWVILDLTGLQFFGTAGFSALHTINVRCAGAGVQWTVVPNHVVSRLLRLCDPDHALPICDSVTGDAAGSGEPRRLLQLVPQPR
jgi:anti-anti-sigma factor